LKTKCLNKTQNLLKREEFRKKGSESTKKRKENPPEIRGWTRIIVETDEKDPVVIATITEEDIDMADGYRVRLRPVYSN
jgi:hypothetical protein